MDNNEEIFGKLLSEIPELQIETLNLESELNETLKGVNIDLSEEQFVLFKYYISKQKDILDFFFLYFQSNSPLTDLILSHLFDICRSKTK